MAIRPAAQVRSMFDAIAARYDFLNHLLSLGLDRSWREVLSERVRKHVGGVSGLRLRRPDRGTEPPLILLDLCCGTGDQAFALRDMSRSVRIVGVDFSRPMVRRAREKARRRGLDGSPAFFAGDAMRLSFRDGTFDAATVSFGLRNLADVDAGLREMARVVRPGGGVFVLEFTMPRIPVLRDAYGFYFRRVLPAVGAFLSRSPDRAYTYLPESVAQFPGSSELARKMEEAGLQAVSCELLTFGTVTLHHGTKPAADRLISPLNH